MHFLFKNLLCESVAIFEYVFFSPMYKMCGLSRSVCVWLNLICWGASRVWKYAIHHEIGQEKNNWFIPNIYIVFLFWRKCLHAVVGCTQFRKADRPANSVHSFMRTVSASTSGWPSKHYWIGCMPLPMGLELNIPTPDLVVLCSMWQILKASNANFSHKDRWQADPLGKEHAMSVIALNTLSANDVATFLWLGLAHCQQLIHAWHILSACLAHLLS